MRGFRAEMSQPPGNNAEGKENILELIEDLEVPLDRRLILVRMGARDLRVRGEVLADHLLDRGGGRRRGRGGRAAGGGQRLGVLAHRHPLTQPLLADFHKIKLFKPQMNADQKAFLIDALTF